MKRVYLITSVLILNLLTFMPPAQATGMNEFSSLLMVPYATYDSASGNTTATSIISRFDGTIYWAFFDENGNRRAFDHFPILAQERHPFVWHDVADASTFTGLSGVKGWLLFALDTDNNGIINAADSANGIAGNAFYVNLTGNDVAYMPTLSLDNAALSENTAANWATSPVASLNPGSGQDADTGDPATLEYFIDGLPGGNDTMIYVWTTRKVSTVQPMTLEDGSGTNKAVELQFLNNNLNVFNAEQIPGMSPAFYGDGFLSWTVPTASDGISAVDAFMFTVVSSAAFGATQTLMADFIE